MPDVRDGFAAVQLRDGRVFVIGGVGEAADGWRSDTVLYDPGAHRWTAGPSMSTERYLPAATVLDDGRVFVAGGRGAGGWLTSAEILDPATEAWQATGSVPGVRPPGAIQIVGPVLVTLVGGAALYLDMAGPAPASEGDQIAAVFAPGGGGGWTRIDPPGPENGGGFRVIPLLDGGAVAAGGWVSVDGRSHLSNVDSLLLPTYEWRLGIGAGAISGFRTDPVAVALQDGRVLVAGGAASWGRLGTPDITASAYVLDRQADAKYLVEPMPLPRQRGTAVALRDGSVLVVGGDVGLVGEPTAPWCPTTVVEAVRCLGP